MKSKTLAVTFLSFATLGVGCNKERTTSHKNMIILTKRIAVLLLVTTLLAIAGAGCGTAHGFGKDVEKAGQGIQDGTK